MTATHDDGAFIAVLVLGSAAYLLAMNAMTLVLGLGRSESLRRPRLILVAALLVLYALGRSWPPALDVSFTTAILLTHIVFNLHRARTA